MKMILNANLVPFTWYFAMPSNKVKFFFAELTIKRGGYADLRLDTNSNSIRIINERIIICIKDSFLRNSSLGLDRKNYSLSYVSETD